ncbi:Ig-like domain-containing protein [Bdellovibrio bacteriovorus]|uniref:Ig-like domain-containing protein n=1 Tax=Bdellovibrio bacteriovorus TaxID=959 RepID=UPI0035A5B4A2
MRKFLWLSLAFLTITGYQNCSKQEMAFEYYDQASLLGVGLNLVPDPNNVHEVNEVQKYTLVIELPEKGVIAKSSVRVNNQEVSTAPDAFGNLKFSFNPESPKNYEIIGEVWTPDGTLFNVSETLPITDEKPPVINLLANSTNKYDLHQTLGFNFKAFDEGGGEIEDLACYLDDARVDCGFNPASATGKFTFKDLDSGTHLLKVLAVDSYNNTGEASLKFSISYDKVAPKITLAAFSANTWFTIDEQKFNLQVDELGAGLKSVICTLDNVAVPCSQSTGKSVLVTQPSTAGNHQLKIVATDRQDNMATTTYTLRSLVDLNKPKITITKNTANTNLINQLQKFAVKIVDLESGLKSYTCLYGSTKIACTLANGSMEVSITPKVAGAQLFVVEAEDRYGNKESSRVTLDIIQDRSAPVVQILADSMNEPLTNKTLKYSFTVSKPANLSKVASVTCFSDSIAVNCSQNATKTSGSFSVMYPTTGAHLIKVVAKDQAGNIGTKSLSLNIKKLVTKTTSLAVTEIKKVDVLFVVDDSGSMIEEQKNMAAKVGSFVSKISHMDWRAAVTTTDLINYDGRLVQIKNLPNTYFVSSAMNPATAQVELGATIEGLGINGSGAEQGIAATNRAVTRRFEAPNATFFRNDAALAVVLISDEDESGNTMLNSGENLISTIKAAWPEKNFSFSSIVKSYATCTTGAMGTKYLALSKLTGQNLKGGAVVGCVGDVDYTSVLSKIGDSVQNIHNMVSLSCSPYKTSVNVKKGATVYNGTRTLAGAALSFSTSLPVGSYTLTYQCVE